MNIAFQPGICNFSTENRIRILKDRNFFRCDFADDTDCKARAGEGLTIDEIIGQSQFTSKCARFILEQ